MSSGARGMIMGVRILCCVVTHNRLAYTQRCVDAWMNTRDPKDDLVVVDNASTDGTREWLDSRVEFFRVFNQRNLFPGAATNIGWSYEDGHDLFMRLDNDIELLPGWREEVALAFESIPDLGLLGLLNMHEDFPDGAPVWPLFGNGYTLNADCPRGVGGNAVVRRDLWDEGLRWAPGSWAPGGNDEDTRFAQAVRNQGCQVARLIPTVANNMSYGRYEDYPDYYQKTAGLRGLVPELSV